MQGEIDDVVRSPAEVGQDTQAPKTALGYGGIHDCF